MRYLSGLFLVAVLAGSCMNDNKGGAGSPVAAVTDSSKFTTIQWIDSVKDFGKIQEGQKLEVSFRFRNTGDKPLVIEHVQPSCGCTVAEQSTEPVAPGGEGQIKATFNSEGKPGVNRKVLTVLANTKGKRDHALTFLVEVQKK